MVSEVRANKISPASGTDITLGDSGDTFTIPSGATIVNSGTATGFGRGKCLQMVVTTLNSTASTTSQIPADDTIPQSGEGIEVVTRAITPSSASSYLVIDYWLNFARSLEDAGFMALFVDSVASAISASAAQGQTNQYTMFGTHTVASSSTDARTYKVRGGASAGGAGTFYVNQAHTVGRWFGGVADCGIRIIEIDV